MLGRSASAGNGAHRALASRSEDPAEIIFIADADAFDDGFYVNPNTGQAISDNAAFILNALDNLSGEAALTALRSRAPAARPMQRGSTIFRAAARDRLYEEQQRLEKLLADAERRINPLEARRKSGAALSNEELSELASYREQASGVRRQLRGVEREFRRDIDALEAGLQFINVWLPPPARRRDRHRRIHLAQPQAGGGAHERGCCCAEAPDADHPGGRRVRSRPFWAQARSSRLPRTCRVPRSVSGCCQPSHRRPISVALVMVTTEEEAITS